MLDFPASPSGGQLYNASNGVVYQWQSPPDIWIAVSGSSPAAPTLDGPINVQWYGADPTGVSDSLPAFNAAMAAFSYSNASQVAPTGGVIKIPHGTYYVSGSINTLGKHGIEFLGDGRQTTIIKAGANTNYPVFKDIGTSVAATNGVRIRKLTIEGGGRANVNAHGIQWDFMVNGFIENVNGGGCNHLFEISNGWQNNMIDVFSDSLHEPKNNISLYCGPQGAGSTQNAINIVNASFYNDVLYAIRAEFFAGGVWQSVQTGGSGTCCISLGNPSTTGDVKWLNADILMVDTCNGRGLEIIKGVNGTFMNDITITNLWAGNTGFIVGSAAVYIDGGEHVQIVGGEILRCDTALEMVNCVDCQVEVAIKEHNRGNTGVAAVKVNGGQRNKISVPSTPTLLFGASIGYNGYVESGGTQKNEIYGFGEAAWTPALAFVTPPTGLVYGTRLGTYSVHGRHVEFALFVSLTNAGAGGAGAASITGLPFATDGGSYDFGYLSSCLLNPAAAMPSPAVAAFVTGSATFFIQQQNATGVLPIVWTNFVNTTAVTTSGKYLKV